MSPIEASSVLATLVGLICSWSQERSGQAAEVLNVLDQLGASRMVVFDHEPVCLFLPNQMPVTFSDARFLETDVAAIESMGFIRMVDQNNRGNPIYAITRAGSGLAATLPEVPL